jgi:hypothetical protein
MLDYEKEYERKAFKTLSRREKLDHIWTYYKVQILIGAFLIFFVAWWINYLFIHPTPDTAFAVYLYSGAIDSDAAEALTEQYTEALPDFLEGDDQFVVQTYLDVDENFNTVEEKIAAITSISAEVSMGEVDVIIGDRDRMLTAVASELLMPLDQIFTEDEWAKLQAAAATRAQTYAKGDVENPEGIVMAEVVLNEEYDEPLYPGEQPYLLCIAGCTEEEQALYDVSTPYLGVACTTKNIDKVKEYIWYLMEK